MEKRKVVNSCITLFLHAANSISNAGYHGPWIENLFIEHFIGKPLSYFNGMIPLFIQWTDMHVHEILYKNDTKLDQYHTRLYQSMIIDLESFIRDDVLYVTICQDDQGDVKVACVFACALTSATECLWDFCRF